MRVGVCVKWVDLRPEVDPLTGEVTEDPRFFGASATDQAALEVGLRLAEESGGTVTAVTAGSAGAVAVLRSALAAGADRAVRVDIDQGSSSAVVAAALANSLSECDVVVCGEWSTDRGSGSVPAFLAHELGAVQALGCIRVENIETGFRAERRLERGRREIVRLASPAVVSVEAGAADLRRAALPGVIAAGEAEIEVVTTAVSDDDRVRTVDRRPYRPRSRELAPPSGADARSRVQSLLGSRSDPTSTAAVELDPRDAADRLLAELVRWGVRPGERS